MGYYINPETGTKEEWLAANARRIELSLIKNWRFDIEQELPICLVDNGIFTAAGIAYSSSEIEAFMETGKIRPTQWFAALRNRLTPFYPNAEKRG